MTDDDTHLVQVRLATGQVLEVGPPRRPWDYDTACVVARRVRRVLRLPGWSPKWGDVRPAYARLAETVHSWHSDVRKAVVEVVRRSDSPKAEHGWKAVLFLPVSLPRAEVGRDNWTWAERN